VHRKGPVSHVGLDWRRLRNEIAAVTGVSQVPHKALHHREQLQAPEGFHFRLLRLPIQVPRVPIQVPVGASST
jgi:hypothetical protein